MKENINQKINIDNIQEYIYNNTNIAKFTYEDYLKYQEKYHPEDNLRDEEMLKNDMNVKEDTEKYEYTNINNEHDNKKAFINIKEKK